jgi:hypothetical protein
MQLEEGLRLVQYEPLPDLDALQDQVLEQLELLNQRIEGVLREFAPQLLAAGENAPSSAPVSTLGPQAAA